MQIEICTICDTRIGLDEQAYVFNNEIICEKCDTELRSTASPATGTEGAVAYVDAPPTLMQLAFARQLLNLTVPKTATRRDVAIMIDEELAYRQLISFEGGSARKPRWTFKPRRVAIALTIAVVLTLLSV